MKNLEKLMLIHGLFVMLTFVALIMLFYAGKSTEGWLFVVMWIYCSFNLVITLAEYLMENMDKETDL